MTSASLAPWQQSSSLGPSAKDEDIYGDKPLIVFWPGGRLHSVERAVAAASSMEDPSSNLVVAISCRQGIVLVTTMPTSPHLDTSTSTTTESQNENEEETKDTTTQRDCFACQAQQQQRMDKTTEHHYHDLPILHGW